MRARSDRRGDVAVPAEAVAEQRQQAVHRRVEVTDLLGCEGAQQLLARCEELLGALTPEEVRDLDAAVHRLLALLGDGFGGDGDVPASVGSAPS